MPSLRRHQASPKAPSPVRPGSGRTSGTRSKLRQCARAPPSFFFFFFSPLRLSLQPPGCTGPRGLSNRPISSPQRFLRAPFKPRAQAHRLGCGGGSGVRGSPGDSGAALCRGGGQRSSGRGGRARSGAAGPPWRAPARLKEVFKPKTPGLKPSRGGLFVRIRGPGSGCLGWRRPRGERAPGRRVLGCGRGGLCRPRGLSLTSPLCPAGAAVARTVRASLGG